MHLFNHRVGIIHRFLIKLYFIIIDTMRKYKSIFSLQISAVTVGVFFAPKWVIIRKGAVYEFEL